MGKARRRARRRRQSISFDVAAVHAAVQKLKGDLAYRLPTSGKPMSHVVLPRHLAKVLVQEFGDRHDLRIE